MGRIGHLVDLRLTDYAEALRIQREIHQRRLRGLTRDTLILVEHPRIITLGKSADPANLLASVSKLRSAGIDLVRTDRGGDVTFHGPGQLVGYPIFALEHGFAGVRSFIRRLESALISALERFGLRGERRPGSAGVWLGDEKIASIGLAVRRRVTLHGFALNVSTDLEPFSLINPCGDPAQKMTSLERVLLRTVHMDEARREVRLGIEKAFNLELREVQLET